ncbi:MAG: hypothetical protein M1817_003447 [Caeruleum heppii]|nr:MAG: hypothetical protein M1817_003447 [Caeruleum heppii]
MATPPSPIRPIITTHLHHLLSTRHPPKTFCPSEVARRLSSTELVECGVSTWRDLMDDVRRLVWDMRERGEVEVLQRGLVLGPEVESVDDVRGPMRVRRTEGEADGSDKKPGHRLALLTSLNLCMRIGERRP